MEPDDIDTDDPERDRPGGDVADAMSDDWDLAMLRELAEMSMALARAVTQNALARLAGVAEGAPEAQAEDALPPAFRGDPVLAQGRAARSVRLTLGLYAKIKRERAAAAQALSVARAEADGGPAAEIAAGAERVRAMLHDIAVGDTPQQVRGALDQLIEEQPIDAAEKDRLREAVEERLEDETDGRLGEPTSAIIAKLCRDLGLKPDWDRWTDEPWAVEEARASSPYTRTERFEAAGDEAGGADELWPFPERGRARVRDGP